MKKIGAILKINTKSIIVLLSKVMNVGRRGNADKKYEIIFNLFNI